MNGSMCRSILMFGIGVSQLIVTSTSWAVQSYSVEELQIPEAIKAVGPNDSGEVAIRSGFGKARSFRGKPGETARDIGVLSEGTRTNANGINDAGDIAGSANGKTAVRAILAPKTGGLRDLGTLPGDSASEALAINNQGEVVGFSGGPKGIRAFLWTPKNGMIDLGTLPDKDSSKALAISDTGLIAGRSGRLASRGSERPVGHRAVLWTKQKIQDLGTLPGDTSSEAYGVNNPGDVVGYSLGPSGLRAFLWTAQDGMQILGALPGGRHSRAIAINNLKVIVGTSESAQGTRAVVWEKKGEPQDLNTLVSLPAGIVLIEATGINAKGQIVALGRNEKDIHGNHEGASRVFLLTPGGK